MMCPYCKSENTELRNDIYNDAEYYKCLDCGEEWEEEDEW